MNNDIKEILDDFKNDVENNLMIEVRGIYYKPLLDYITNLQNKYENSEKNIDLLVDEIYNLEIEKEELLERMKENE